MSDEGDRPLSVLVADDDEKLRGFLLKNLPRYGYVVEGAPDGQIAIDLIGSKHFDAVLCDIMMPGKDGFDVLRFCASLPNSPPVIIMTAFGSMAYAVEAMRLGAVDFIEKPMKMNELDAAIRNAVSTRRRRPDDNAAPPTATSPGSAGGIIGSDTWLPAFLELLNKLAASDNIVLIQGETGTGKTAIAKEIWQRSRRRSGPFVYVNCAAISESLLESELFGHVKGAFTGAVSDHIGKVEAAEAGTLFLDEIGELKLELQAKLLHLLQDFMYTPVGSVNTKRANVRFLAATNRNLLEMVEAREFRSDLYFRLEPLEITISPLRKRGDDVPLLVKHFRQQAAKERSAPVPDFSQAAIEMLRRYNWPGNVRELENLVKRLTTLHFDVQAFDVEHLPERIRINQRAEEKGKGSVPPELTANLPDVAVPDLDNLSLKESVDGYERNLIIRALARWKGNKSKAAEELGTKRTTLIEKVKKYGITPGDYDGSDDEEEDPGSKED